MVQDFQQASRRRACVFCASHTGARPVYQADAAEFGTLLAQAGFGLVYGGAQVGLMGAVADAALKSGGEVLGVIPRALETREVAHHALSRLFVVETMHERKARMVSLSDAFVALPGGYGTLDEFFEAVTWLQLGIHSKPCLLVNTNGYFDRLIGFLDFAAEEAMIAERNRALIQTCSSASEAVALLDHLWRSLPVEREAPAAPAP